jgi:LysR family hydrogen peroxide-inducible transcriptional activator
MPTITQLEYIIAVDSLRHFGLAAKECYVTQPTLSMQIKKAEEDLGVIIFDRSKQPVLPTDVGKELIKQARNILREVQALHQIVDDFRNVISGNLRVGIIPTVSPYVLPLFVGKFAKKYPKIKLHIRELHTNNIIEELQNDRLDVGLFVTPTHVQGLKEIPLFYEEIKIYSHPSHKHAKKQSIESAQLSNENLWMLSEGNCFRNQTLNLCSSDTGGKNLPFRFESGSLESLKRLVDQEGGFTLMPELAVSNMENIRSIVNPTPIREVSLVYVRNFAKTKLLKLFAEEIQEAVPPKMLNKERGKIIEWM